MLDLCEQLILSWGAGCFSLSCHSCYCSSGMEERTENGEVQWHPQCPEAKALAQAPGPRAQAHSYRLAKEKPVSYGFLWDLWKVFH